MLTADIGQKCCGFTDCGGMSHSRPNSGYLGKLNWQISLPEEITLQIRRQKTYQRC